jgi:hypothetical protein
MNERDNREMDAIMEDESLPLDERLRRVQERFGIDEVLSASASTGHE